MLGFSLPKNFKHPYVSVTMTEFWRRWHITLGSWFRDYVYIPLGGNRKGVLENNSQFADRLAAYGIMARCRLQLFALGLGSVSDHTIRKAVDR